jgi:heme-degrading monooxygenase HmoA
MHARIAVFEQRDPEGLSELRRLIQLQADAWEQKTGAIAFYALADRTSGIGYGVTLFEDERALRKAEPVFEKMGKEVPESLRGKRVSVAAQEVVVHDVRDGAMAVRISRLTGKPATVADRFREAADHLLPELRMVDGWKGMIACLDQTKGETMTLTLWESQAALDASERRADEMRRDVAEETGTSIVSVARCEIIHAHDRAPRLVPA